MLTYEQILSNYEAIVELCIKYRKELTINQGIVLEKTNIVDMDTYIKFMGSLSNEVYVGNMCTFLLNELAIKDLRRVLDGTLGIDDVFGFYKEIILEFKTKNPERVEKYL